MKKTILKSITIGLVLTAMLFCFALSSFAEEKPVTVYVDGVKINFDVDPIIENGRTLVPLRYIFEALGAKVDWRGETSTAVAKKGEDTIEISIGSNVLYKNGTPTELDVGAKLIDGRTLVPARAVSEGMGCDVSWDAEERRVIIRSKGSLDFSELSAEDEALVLSEYPAVYEHIIYDSLYNNFKESGKEYYMGISEKADNVKAFVDYVWNAEIMNSVLRIQEKSETIYVINAYDQITEKNITDAYAAIGKKLGMSAESAYTSSYETTPGKKTVFLLDMKKPEMGCMFAGAVAVDETVRYFVCSKSDYDNMEFFEINDTGLTAYNYSVKNKNDFLSAIDKVLKQLR